MSEHDSIMRFPLRAFLKGYVAWAWSALVLLLLFSFVVAAPVGYYFGQDWLKGFADKTIISPLLFVVSFLLVVAITMLTVTYQSWKNANENPINSIKTE